MHSLAGRLPSLVSPAALILLWLAGSGCEQRLSPARRAHAEQGLRGAVESWARAVNNRAIDTLATLYHRGPELLLTIPDGRRIAGWEQLDALLHEVSGSMPQFNYLVQDVVVEIPGENVGITSFRTSIVVENGGSRRGARGWTTQVWIRDADGRPWRIRAEHHSTISAARNG